MSDIRYCTATSKRTGNRCGQVPPPGWDVCKWHGGGAPQVAHAAAVRQVEDEGKRLLRVIGVEPVDDVLGALSQLAGEVVAWKNQIGRQVELLEELRYQADGPGGEQLRAEVAAFQAAMRECRMTLVDIAKLNIESRLARISEQQAEVVIKVVTAALTSAGITGQAADEARSVASRHLRAAS